MSDIVTELRDRAYSGKIPDRLSEEAADEIERLRGSTVERRFCEPTVAGSTPAAGFSGCEQPVTEPMPKEKRTAVSVAEPVAWAVTMGDGSVYEAFAAHQHDEAAELAKRCLFGADGPLPLAPLYRRPQPTLTDAEREAVEWILANARLAVGVDRAATLRGLLERMA